MNRAVNAVAIGIAAFLLLAGLVWAFLVVPPSDSRPLDTTPSDTTSDSTTTATTTTETTPPTTTTTTTTPPPTTTTTTPTKPPKPTDTTPANTSGAAAEFSLHDNSANEVASLFSPQRVGATALHFMAGGMILLSFGLALTLVVGLFPGGAGTGAPVPKKLPSILPTPDLENPPDRRPMPMPGQAPVPPAGRKAPDAPLDLNTVLKDFAYTIGGQPRVMRILDDRIVVRLYDCPECRAGSKPSQAGCFRTAAHLQSALQGLYREPLKVFESACRGRGDAVCEIEVQR